MSQRAHDTLLALTFLLAYPLALGVTDWAASDPEQAGTTTTPGQVHPDR